MIYAMSPTQSRRLAAMILAAAVLLFYVMFVMPVAGMHGEYEETIADLGHRLEHYRRAVQSGAENQRLLEEYKRRRPSAGYYLKAPKAALASAELQQHVEKVVRDSGARLVSIQVVSSEERAPFPHVAVKSHLQGDIESLRTVIYTLEAGRPVLFLDNVFIAVSPARAAPGGQGGGEAAALDVHLDVIGYRQGGDD